MRYQSMILPVLTVMLFAVACDNGDNPEVPRTLPPTLKSTITTIDVPAIPAPASRPQATKPTKPRVVSGTGPIYET